MICSQKANRSFNLEMLRTYQEKFRNITNGADEGVQGSDEGLDGSALARPRRTIFNNLNESCLLGHYFERASSSESIIHKARYSWPHASQVDGEPESKQSGENRQEAPRKVLIANSSIKDVANTFQAAQPDIRFKLVSRDMKHTRAISLSTCRSAEEFYAKSTEFFEVFDEVSWPSVLSCHIPALRGSRSLFDKDERLPTFSSMTFGGSESRTRTT